MSRRRYMSETERVATLEREEIERAMRRAVAAEERLDAPVSRRELLEAIEYAMSQRRDGLGGHNDAIAAFAKDVMGILS